MKKLFFSLVVLCWSSITFGACPPTCFELSTPGDNVGIGSTNPGAALDVKGTVRATSFTGIGSNLTGTNAMNSTGSAATVTTAAQPAITSLGVLTSLRVNGNVGINSATPGQAIDVQGSVRAIQFFGGGGSLTGISGSVSGLTTNNVPKAASSSTFGTGSLTDLNGNIGVGSTAPGKALDVAGTVRATAFYGDGTNITGISGSISGLTTNYIPKASGSTSIANGDVIDVAPNVGIGSATPGQVLDVNGTVRATAVIAGAGSVVLTGVSSNLGIGSATPGQTLDINGIVRATGLQLNLAPLAGGNVLVSNGVGIGTWMPPATIGAGGGGSSQWTTINTNDVYLPNSGNVGIGGNKTTTAALSVLGGNVGIGTWVPSQPLDVSGSLRGTAFTATGVGMSAFSTGITVNGTGNSNITQNLGIGSVSPGQALDVAGTIRQTGFILTGNNAAQGSVLMASGTVGIGTWSTLAAGAGSGTVNSGSTPEAAYYPSNTATVGPVSNVFMAAGTNNLNVGIGSSNPGTSLDVNGTARVLDVKATLGQASAIANDAVFNAKLYGAKGDGIHGYGGTITSGTNTFSNVAPTYNSGTTYTPGMFVTYNGTVFENITTALNHTPVGGTYWQSVPTPVNFRANDVGKVIVIVKAGAAGADLTTTISAFTDANDVVLTDNAGTTASGVDYSYGTDDTTAIQNAINALGTNGGGTVFFPAGEYIVNGAFGTNPASQLYLPNVTFGSVPVYVRFLGQDENRAPYSNSITGVAGSIIFFTQNGASGQSGLGAYGSDQAFSKHFSNIAVGLEKLTFRMVTNPTSAAVDLRLAAQAFGTYLTFDHDYSNSIGNNLTPSDANTVQPTHSSNVALYTPQYLNFTNSEFNHIFVFDYYTGIVADEHSLFSAVSLNSCIYGWEFNGGFHAPIVLYSSVQRTTNSIHITNNGEGSKAAFLAYIDVENSNTPTWGQIQYYVDDPNNYGVGTIYLEQNQGGCTGNQFKNGAQGVNIICTATNQLYAGNKMLVNSFQGNIGIGSANPGQALDVQGTIRTTNFILSTSPTVNYVLTSDANGVGTWQAATGGGGGGGASFSPSAAQGDMGFLDVQGTVTYIGGNSGVFYTGTSSTQGNVGIGSVSPGSALDVQGTARVFGNLDVNGTVNPSLYTVGANVGIGSTNPGTVLDVQGTSRVFGTLDVLGTVNNLAVLSNAGTTEFSVSSAGNITANGTATINGSNTTQNSLASGAVINSGLNTSANGGDFYAYTNVGVGTIYVNATSGNVGIGSVTPGSNLDVQGTMRILPSSSTLSIGTTSTTSALNVGSTNGFQVASGGSIVSLTNDTNGQVSNVKLQLDGNSTVTVGNVNSSSSAAMDIFAGQNAVSHLDLKSTTGIGTTDYIRALVGNNGGTEALRIIDSGNVGIGSVNPGQALDVVGTVRALSGGACTTLYKCQGGTDAGIIQTSSCTLCPASSCVALNGCF